MSTIPNYVHPTNRQLIRATLLSVIVAGLILVTIVLPAEFGIDPTGIGKRLGLTTLSESEAPAAVVPVAAPASADEAKLNSELAARAQATFGAFDGQSLDASAFSASSGTPHQQSFTVTLEPGKGAEVKAKLKAGDGMVFHWVANGDVAVDMHGERPEVKNAWTTYAVEAAQRESAGTFIAPFEGTHGWFWQNRGTQPVTVTVDVSGFQSDLYKP